MVHFFLCTGKFASVYSNRGEKNTGKMLENIIIKLQTLTGGLRGGKSLHHFVFNGLDLIVKHCLPLLFRKEPIYRGKWKGHRAGASEEGINISLEFLSPAEPLLPPKPSQGPLLQAGVSWSAQAGMGSSPGAAHTPCPDEPFLLLAACSSWAQL